MTNLDDILSQAIKHPKQFQNKIQATQYSPLFTGANANWLFISNVASNIATKIRHGENFDLDQTIVQTEASISRVVGFRWQDRYRSTITDAPIYLLKCLGIEYMRTIWPRVLDKKERGNPRKEIPDAKHTSEPPHSQRTVRSNPDEHDADSESNSAAPTTTQTIIEATNLVFQVLKTHKCTPAQIAKISLALQSLIAQTGGQITREQIESIISKALRKTKHSGADDVATLVQTARSILDGQANPDQIAALAQLHQRYTEQEATPEQKQGDTRHPIIRAIIKMFSQKCSPQQDDETSKGNKSPKEKPIRMQQDDETSKGKKSPGEKPIRLPAWQPKPRPVKIQPAMPKVIFHQKTNPDVLAKTVSLIAEIEHFPTNSTYIILHRQRDHRDLASSIENIVYRTPMGRLPVINLAYDPIVDQESEETPRVTGYVKVDYECSVKCGLVDNTLYSTAIYEVLKIHPNLYHKTKVIPDATKVPAKISLLDEYADGKHVLPSERFKRRTPGGPYFFEGHITQLTNHYPPFEVENLFVGDVHIIGARRDLRIWTHAPNIIVSQAILDGWNNLPRVYTELYCKYLRAGLHEYQWLPDETPLEITVVTSYPFAEALELQQRFSQRLTEEHQIDPGIPWKRRPRHSPSLALIGGNSDWRSQLYAFIQSEIQAGKEVDPWPPSSTIADADVFFIRDYYEPGVHATFGTSDELTKSVCFPPLLEILAHFNLGYGPRQLQDIRA
ncbi:MAG: hypothetical protein LBF65_00500 [Holosporales bacterium]|nr:hypothetical protein [Holosporales bacterium]